MGSNPPGRNKRLLVFAGLAIAGAAIVGAVFRDDRGSPTVLQTPPAAPAITAAAFDADSTILAAIATEAQRRLDAAGRSRGDTHGVLPASLRHLHCIGLYEPEILLTPDFTHVIRLASGPTPLLPPLADLGEAYRAIGEDEAAAVIDAVAAAIAAGSLEEQASDLMRRLRAEIAKPGRAARRVTYARAHREEILVP